MAEITGTTEQASGVTQPETTGAAPPTTTATTAEATTTQAAATTTPEVDPEKARLERELAEVRREAAANRVKLKQFETAQMTAEEQQKVRLAELEAENARLATTAKARAIESAITQAATAQGVKATLAVKLVDEAKIAFDENGNVTNAADLVKLLAQENPELIVRNGGGIGNPGRTGAEDAVAHEAHLRQILGGGHGSPFSVEVARANPVIIPGR